jgi:2-aminoadipate transaminase
VKLCGVGASPIARTLERQQLYAIRAAGLGGSVIDASTTLLQLQTHDVVRLAMGSPAAEAIPTATFEQLLHTAAHSVEAFDYAATEGDPELRAALLEFLTAEGDPVAPERLLITSGGMQGLDLVCKLFVDPGDLVAVESPTYTNGSATIASYEGEILEVPVDDDGMDVDALVELVAHAGRFPKLIYAIPTFQNPSGATLSLARREKLIELAAAWACVIVEDDPYGMLRFSGAQLPSLRQLGDEAGVPVVAVHTFSKILAPGLRVGWVVADPAVIDLMVKARQAMDTCTNVLQQRMIAGFLTGGHMVEHLIAVRAEYALRKQGMDTALAEELATLESRWTDPEGGFFLWLTLPEALDTGALFPIALEEGVAYIPGTAFSPSGRFTNALRLAFSAQDPSRTREGIRRLRRAIDRQLAGV